MAALNCIRMVAVGMALGLWGLAQALAEPVAYPETVQVGNPNNLPDNSGYGSVSYAYRIGKFEVTNEQYCEFLNAVEKTGKYGLYRWQMGKNATGGIAQSGSSGDYTFTVKDGMTKKPAVLMNWYETLRFCNWLSNGKGEGGVETGPYTFANDFGVMTIKKPDHAALAAGTKVQWVLASEDEWYKAAYFDPNKSGSAGYRRFPSTEDDAPEANLGSGGLTEVGAFSSYPSPYGTFDQGGNAWEWNETKTNGRCGIRGGSFWHGDNAQYMSSGTRYVTNPPEFVYDNYGFRVVALGGKPGKQD
jgi:sulfatase modifying factor 1